MSQQPPPSQRGEEDDSETDLTLSASPSRLSAHPVDVDQDGMKRAAAKKLIERYFYQLVDGCGNPNCNNKYCASSGETSNITPNEAAAQAIQLFSQEARLCETSPNKVPRTNTPTNSPVSERVFLKNHSNNRNNYLESGPSRTNSSHSDGFFLSNKPGKSSSIHEEMEIRKPLKFLTEESLAKLCSQWESSPKLLIRAIGEVFSQPSCLARCFPAQRTQVTDVKPPKSSIDKEVWRSKENDPDKDIDLEAYPPLDIESCRRAFEHLKAVPSHIYCPALVTAIETFCEIVLTNTQVLRNQCTKQTNLDDYVNCFLILFQIPGIGSGDLLETALPCICKAVDQFCAKGQAKLAQKWALLSKDNLRYILEALQQLITVKVISTTYTREYMIQDDTRVTLATELMKVLYYANLLAGVMDSSSLREEDIELPNRQYPLRDELDIFYPFTSKVSKQSENIDPLAKELEINVIDSRCPFIPFDEFYNETLSDHIEMDRDFAYYKTESGFFNKYGKFSFMRYSFILTPATKSLGLYYDNRIRMYSQRRASFFQAAVGASQPMPYLRLKVRRQNLIDDALIELEMVAMERVSDLKKQLVVEFEGEQGVDEGGVSKEFFQLIVEEIFNPDYGMFTLQQDTQTMWFNSTSFETEGQFTLIGIVLGLAIYNNVILAVNFPMVVYRKLMGKKGSLEDLADWNPTLYNGLKSMLDYTGDDMQDVFMQTFKICYQDVFGNNVFHELKENGDQVFVTQENKHEFVDLYADFLLNKSIETQFKAFRKGFLMVTDESPLSLLFRPEEIEQLVCGSKNFDFNELELATEYDAGYTADSQIIKDFWSIVHSLTLEDKRKLLQFCTGSDRVPVGGLIRLKLIIAKNGPDSDRLPTAHTCFNILLLPEYESKEKLSDRLLKAINYAKGFGML